MSGMRFITCMAVSALWVLSGSHVAQAQVLPAGLDQAEWLSIQRQIIEQQSRNGLETADKKKPDYPRFSAIDKAAR